MPSILDRFRGSQDEPDPSSDDAKKAGQAPPPADNESTMIRMTREANSYLDSVVEKMSKLSDDFAQGRVNRTQFEELYKHYMQERRTIEKLMQVRPRAWKSGVTEGESVVIRRTHAAHPLGYAIYRNTTRQLLRMRGDFHVDEEVLVSTLTTIRAATEQVFGAELKNTEIEGGNWMSFVPGQYTTLVVLFTLEPARLQMEMLEQLHEHFERANRHVLASDNPDPAKLVYPHAAAFE